MVTVELRIFQLTTGRIFIQANAIFVFQPCNPKRFALEPEPMEPESFIVTAEQWMEAWIHVEKRAVAPKLYMVHSDWHSL